MVEQQWSTLGRLASHRLVGGNQRPAEDRGSVVAGGIGLLELPRATQVRPSRRRGRRRGCAVGVGVCGGEGGLSSQRAEGQAAQGGEAHTSTRSRWLSVPPPSAGGTRPAPAHTVHTAAGCMQARPVHHGCSLGARGLQPGHIGLQAGAWGVGAQRCVTAAPSSGRRCPPR